jgi:hypothetical protein
MYISRLIIRNYCGIKAADIEIPPKGIVITGGNRRGKTSILRAAKAALLARGVDPLSIRLGEEKAELLVDLAGGRALHVRRSIRQRGSDISVTGADGLPEGKPQTLLTDLFGQDLDPLAFYLAKDPERRRMLYELMPMDVQVEDVMRWTQGRETPWEKPPGHGLEVIAGIREKYYAKRTAANAAAKESARGYKELRTKLDAMGAPASAVSIVEAAKLLADAQRELNELTGRQAAYEQARQKAGPTRDRIEKIRNQPPLGAGPQLDLREPGERARVSGDRVRVLRLELEEAEKAHRADLEDLALMERAAVTWKETVAARENDLRQAKELEASLAGIDSMGIPPQEVTAAGNRVQAAAAALAQANLAADYKKAHDTANEARSQALNDGDLAEALDDIVNTLTKDAPLELAARSEAIPGLAIGEHITLDGIAIATLSGMEQIRFSVDLAKRVKKEGKVLIVDDMEKLDSEEFPGFVEMAVAGGWQLIGARVTGKEIEIIAIGKEETT